MIAIDDCDCHGYRFLTRARASSSESPALTVDTLRTIPGRSVVLSTYAFVVSLTPVDKHWLLRFALATFQSMRTKPSIYVYVDGFNLFRRSLSGTEHLWLDVFELAKIALPRYEVIGLKYFTAIVKPHQGNLYAAKRQEVYLEALRSRTEIEVHLGYFRRDVSEMPIHPWEWDQDGRPITVKVKQTREKGSDVNLATHLIWDALHNTAEAYAVLTNDSDLVTPIRMLRELKGIDVGVIFPTNQASKDLATCCSWSRHIHPGMLRRSHFESPLTLANGRTLIKPTEWE